MEIEFKETYLEDLYEGKKNDRFKSNPQLIQQYIKTVKKLQAISKIEELYKIQSLHYEKKIGNLEGKSAVWINRQFRLIFEEIQDVNPPYTVRILSLEEISKHYQ